MNNMKSNQSGQALRAPAALALVILLMLGVAGRAAERPAATREMVLGSLPPNANARARDAYAKLPLSFERNAGQMDPSVRYMAQIPGGIKYFARSAVIDALATIIFDNNDSIDTLPIFNTVDAGWPTSLINALPPEIQWTDMVLTSASSDGTTGSGVGGAAIYVSTDNGPYTLAQAGVTGGTTVFRGQAGHTYRFFSLAQDNAGNHEAPKSSHVAITHLFVPGVPADILLAANPTVIPADGTSTSVITATVLDRQGDPLTGQSVSFATTPGNLSTAGGATNASGVVTTTLTGGTTPGTAEVSATADNATALVAIQVVSLPTATPTPTNTPTAPCTSTPSSTPSSTATPACGLAWRAQASPNVAGANSHLHGVAAISPGDVWAVGYSDSGSGSQSLILRWNGVQWNMVPAPDVGSLYGVSALSASDVWAVGAGILHWDGSQWSAVPHPRPCQSAAFYGVSARSQNDVWVVGSCWREVATETLVERWDGVQWSVVPTPELAIQPTVSIADYQAVSALAEDDVWAVGSINLSGGSYTLVGHWDGVEWTSVPAQSPGYQNRLYGVAAIAPNNVWAVGRKTLSGQSSSTLVERWDGTEWTVIPSPNIGTGENTLYGVAALAPNDIWAIGRYLDQDAGIYRPLTMHWDGTQWSIVPGPGVVGTYSVLNSVSALSSEDVWAAGGLTAGSGDETLVARLSDPCATATPSTSPTLTRTTTPSTTPTQTPALIVRGRVLMEGRSTPPNPRWSIPVSGTLLLAGGGASLDFAATTDSSGYFTINTWLPPGDYLWRVKNPQMLANAGQAVLAAGVNHVEMGLFKAGDANDNNCVTAQDFNIVRASFGLSVGQVGYDWRADFNGDDIVAATDFSLLRGTFGTCGAPPLTIWTPTPTSTTTPDYAPTSTPTGISTSTATPTCEPGFEIVSSPNNGTRANVLHGVEALSPTNAWAVGEYDAGVNTYRTLVMRWDGAQWSLVSSPNVGPSSNHLNGVAAVSATDAWAVGHYNNGTADRTLIMHWTGGAWFVVSSPNNGSGHNRLLAVFALAANDVWAVGNYYTGGVFQTLAMHWNGTQWSIVPTPNSGTGANSLRGIAGTAANDLWAVGNYLDANNVSQVLIERWNGTGWNTVLAPPNLSGSSLRGVAALASSDAWAVGSSSDGALIVRWDGSQWAVVPSPDVPSNSVLYGISALSSNDIWAAGASNEAGSYQSLIEHWDGDSWSLVQSWPAGRDLFSVDAFAPGGVWAAGYRIGSNVLPQTLTEMYYQCLPPTTPTPTAISTPTPTSSSTSTLTLTPTNAPTSTVAVAPQRVGGP